MIYNTFFSETKPSFDLTKLDFLVVNHSGPEESGCPAVGKQLQSFPSEVLSELLGHPDGKLFEESVETYVFGIFFLEARKLSSFQEDLILAESVASETSRVRNSVTKEFLNSFSRSVGRAQNSNDFRHYKSQSKTRHPNELKSSINSKPSI